MTEAVPPLYFGKRASGVSAAPAAPPQQAEVAIKVSDPVEPLKIEESPIITAPQQEKATEAVKTIEVANPMLEDVQEGAAGDEMPTVRAKGRSTKAVKRRVSRFQMTDELMDVLSWIDKARYSSSEQVAVFVDADGRSARKILGKLEGHGYLKRKQFAGFPMVYFLSTSAKDLLGSDTKAVDEATGPGFIRHTLGVGWVMLGLLKGQVDWSKAAEKALGRSIRLDDFVSEPELQRATHRRYGEWMTALERQAKNDGRKTYVAKWEGWDSLAKELESVTAVNEFNGDALWAWPLYSSGRKPHYPDLVLRLPRDDAGKPRSIALEIERSVKPHSAYEILNSYNGQLSGDWDNIDAARYHSCVWVCADQKVKESVTRSTEGRSGSHVLNTLAVLLKWKKPYLAQLELAAKTTTAAHKAARARSFWHVTSQRVVMPCVCGTTCRARFGQFKSKQEALALVDEMA